MANQYAFSNFCAYAAQVLQFYAQEQSQTKFKKRIETDTHWKKVLPDLILAMQARLFILLFLNRNSQLPWDGIFSEIEEIVDSRELPDLSGFLDADLPLRVMGRIWINRVANGLVHEFCVDMPEYDNQQILHALLFDCLSSKESDHCFLELSNRIKTDPYKKASFGITLDQARFPNEVNSAYQTLSGWAKAVTPNAQWTRDDFHLWLEEQAKKPFHRQIQDSLTLRVHNHRTKINRQKKHSREKLMGVITDDDFSKLELACFDTTEDELELTEYQRTEIKELLSGIEGARPETGLAIIECIWQTGMCGATRISREISCSPKTVSRYIGTRGRKGFLAQIEDELRDLF